MTTNHKSMIDPALLRSGRIDYEVRFDFVTEEQVKRIFCRFYDDYIGEESDESREKQRQTQVLAREFARAVTQGCERSGLKMTAADVQGHLMRHKKTPKTAMERVGELLQRARERVSEHGD